MTPETFSTYSLPQRDQFEAWHNWYGSVFETTPRFSLDKSFRAENVIWRLGNLTICRVTAPGSRAFRSRALIRRSPVDHWVINVGKRGAARLTIGDRSLEPSPGAAFVLSLADELIAERSAFDLIQLFLPRDSFHGLDASLDGARATLLGTPEGKLLAEYILLLEQSLPALAPEDGLPLSRAIEAMVAACLAPARDRVVKARTQLDFTLMERVRRAVRAHLRSPSLGPDKLCREAATSRSQLYRLLEGQGGVAHYIQRCRLSESFTLLSDGSNVLPIASVAEILCFADASSFSRAFRREFGVSPSDVRASSLAGSPPMVKSPASNGIHSFGDCLSDL